MAAGREDEECPFYIESIRARARTAATRTALAAGGMPESKRAAAEESATGSTQPFLDRTRTESGDECAAGPAGYGTIAGREAVTLQISGLIDVLATSKSLQDDIYFSFYGKEMDASDDLYKLIQGPKIEMWTPEHVKMLSTIAKLNSRISNLAADVLLALAIRALALIENPTTLDFIPQAGNFSLRKIITTLNEESKNIPRDNELTKITVEQLKNVLDRLNPPPPQADCCCILC